MQNSETKETDAAEMFLNDDPHYPNSKMGGTRVVKSELARKLERERDEARQELERLQIVTQEHATEYNRRGEELTQLRKVCDELAHNLNCGIATHGDQCYNRTKCEFLVDSEKSLSNYSILPHVIKAKGNT